MITVTDLFCGVVGEHRHPNSGAVRPAHRFEEATVKDRMSTQQATDERQYVAGPRGPDLPRLRGAGPLRTSRVLARG